VGFSDSDFSEISVLIGGIKSHRQRPLFAAFAFAACQLLSV